MCYRFCAEIALILNYKSQHLLAFIILWDVLDSNQ